MISNDLAPFVEVMPYQIKDKIKDNLIEIVLDLGRKPEAIYLDKKTEYLDEYEITESDLSYVCNGLSFGLDERAGIESTLHRISAIRDRNDNIVGLTCRFGRAIYGACNIIKDLIDEERSILLLGIPGSGKTSRLRDISRYISTELKKRVIIVDSSNEIAGQGSIPHESVGRSRRMQVKTPAKQYEIMLSAVENHTPEVIIIDEIGDRRDVDAARTIAERGVQLFATAHGQTLNNIIDNPVLVELIGGIQAVTLSDNQAIQKGCKKTVLERKHNPTFNTIVEIIDFNTVSVYRDVKSAVDLILDGINVYPELRHQKEDGELLIEPQRQSYSELEYIKEKIKIDDEEVKVSACKLIPKNGGNGLKRKK